MLRTSVKCGSRSNEIAGLVYNFKGGVAGTKVWSSQIPYAMLGPAIHQKQNEGHKRANVIQQIRSKENLPKLAIVSKFHYKL